MNYFWYIYRIDFFKDFFEINLILFFIYNMLVKYSILFSSTIISVLCYDWNLIDNYVSIISIIEILLCIGVITFIIIIIINCTCQSRTMDSVKNSYIKMDTKSNEQFTEIDSPFEQTIFETLERLKNESLMLKQKLMIIDE